MTDTATAQSIEAAWRAEAPQLIASLTRVVRDISVAEELAQDALIAALKQWPESGIPAKPIAWLLATAKRRAIDRFRHMKMAYSKLEEYAADLQSEQDYSDDQEHATDEVMADDMLRLIFTSCHPVLSMESRVALTLRLIGGLSTEEIARAFLAPTPTIAQRITRAKKTIADAKLPYEVPSGPGLMPRLASVLGVIYLVFNEGYAATTGDDAVRPQLCLEAIRLCRLVARVAPNEPEVHGLLALLELQASRLNARNSADGSPVLIANQDRTLWNWTLITSGLASLGQAERLTQQPGSYVLQAAIAACHARVGTAAETDWEEIASLYDQLVLTAPSPIVEVNRAVAHAMHRGPEVGLKMLDALANEPMLKSYHLLPSVRGDFLFKLGRFAEAEGAFKLAASMTESAADKAYLITRANKCKLYFNN